MNKVKINEYRRKFYDVKVELDITSYAMKRIYIDEIDQYRKDMNKEMLKTYGCDENYVHKDEFNEQNMLLAEDLAKDDVADDDWEEYIEIQEMNVIQEPITGEENTAKQEIWRCVICYEHFTGFGNNPDPIKNYGDCCDACNTNKVIPERMRQIINQNHLGVA